MKLVAQPAERMSHMEAESLADSLQPVMFGDMSAWSLPHFPVKLSPVICYNGKKSKKKKNIVKRNLTSRYYPPVSK